MIDFRKPTLEDKEWINRKIEETVSPSCEYTFGNIFAYTAKMEIMVAECFSCLVTRCIYDGELMYCYPMGNGDKKAAVEALKNHYKGKKLLPKEFTADNHIEEVKGVYVPFWLFNGEADASAVYKATRSFTHRRGEYEIITTQHFVIKRRGNIPFEKIPVDASSKMPDEYMDSIEPFDYGELKPFSTAYLPGYFADKYDVKAEASIGRAETRIENTALDCLRSTVTGYLTCVTVGKNVNIKRGKAEYALLPVWVLCTKWNGQNYLFTMNGQTGKLVGDLPVSMKKFWAYFFAIAIPLMVIFAIAMLLI